MGRLGFYQLHVHYSLVSIILRRRVFHPDSSSAAATPTSSSENTGDARVSLPVFDQTPRTAKLGWIITAGITPSDPAKFCLPSGASIYRLRPTPDGYSRRVYQRGAPATHAWKSTPSRCDQCGGVPENPSNHCGPISSAVAAAACNGNLRPIAEFRPHHHLNTSWCEMHCRLLGKATRGTRVCRSYRLPYGWVARRRSPPDLVEHLPNSIRSACQRSNEERRKNRRKPRYFVPAAMRLI